MTDVKKSENNTTFQIEVWGDYACFTRPEMKVERVSYDVMTPSAARGIIEAIYWHPGLRYQIDKIYLLSPVRFYNIRRNEVSGVIFASSALTALKNDKQIALYASKQRQLRAAMVLKDVHYVIEGHFTMTDRAAPGDNPVKFREILRRRVRRGQFYCQPYFGCREFPVHFREWTEGKIPALPVTQDLGYMLYDMDYSNPENIKPKFFRAKLVDGVMNTKDCEVSM